jgi:hypothetical protein
MYQLNLTFRAFLLAYGTLGYQECQNGALEPGFGKKLPSTGSKTFLEIWNQRTPPYNFRMVAGRASSAGVRM